MWEDDLFTLGDKVAKILVVGDVALDSRLGIFVFGYFVDEERLGSKIIFGFIGRTRKLECAKSAKTYFYINDVI